MKNRDNSDHEFVHLYIALRRRKENEGGRELCFRQIIVDDEVDYNCLVERISQVAGVWRIHKTINKRSTSIAVKELQKKLIDEPELHSRLLSTYKTLLMKPNAKAERNILIDIDVDDYAYCDYILKKLKDVNPNQGYQMQKTPNGYHVVSPKFDTRILDNEDVTILRDGYRFVSRIDTRT